jgi:DNA polymerase (family 10)
MRGGRLDAQAKQIDELNERLAPFRILKGVEVNIRADGSLDLDDETLAARDWVMASVHSGFDNDPTGRVLSAMENPHIDCIGHLTSRKINRRRASDIDVERVVEAALATGTFIEINSQPDRLDLRDADARLAAEAGLRLVVNSDAHETGALSFLDIGIAQARRGWLTRDQVLNTRPWAEVARLRKSSP